MSISYGWEKLHKAILTLASSNSDIHERLIYAWDNLIPLVPDEDLPEEIQDEFISLKVEATATKADAGEGTLIASVRAMSTTRAGEIAERLVSMYDRTVRADSRAND